MLLPRINTVIRPPAVFRPINNGAISGRSSILTFSSVLPPSRAAYTAVPYATTSSRLMLLHGYLLLKYTSSRFCTLGMQVEPSTSTISFTLLLDTPQSLSYLATGAIGPLNRPLFSFSNFARYRYSE